MATPMNMNSDAEDIFALALRLPQLSSDDFDEQIAQLPPEASASANHIYRPRTPTSDDKEDLALALRLSLLPFNEQVTSLHRAGSTFVSEDARSSTLPNESDEGDVELALILSQLPADTFDEKVSELNRLRESRMTVEDSLASLLAAMSLAEVRMVPSLRRNKPLTVVLGRYTGPLVGLGFGFGRRFLWIGPARRSISGSDGGAARHVVA
jgi:hypothetical protein